MRRLHGHLDLTEEDMEVGVDGGSIALLVDGELGSVRAKIDLAPGGLPFGQSTVAGGEVGGIRVRIQTADGLAGFCRTSVSEVTMYTQNGRKPYSSGDCSPSRSAPRRKEALQTAQERRI